MKTFRKMSCYVTQDDLLRSFVTVREIIHVTANLKLRKDFSPNEKETAGDEIIKIMGLEQCADTRTEYLSGGERKRLSVALEMIKNPMVLFIDEPTTGLDNVIANKFIQFLNCLVRQGRTIVCTIHQPSNSMFQLFDHVYFMSDGWCTYSGDVNGIVPFLSGLNLPCPSNYAPFDYIIELVDCNEQNMLILKNATNDSQISQTNDLRKKKEYIEDAYLEENQIMEFTTFLQQVWVLTGLLFTEIKRNRILLAIQWLVHIFVTLVQGGIYQSIGNNAEKSLQIFYLFLCLITYHSFVQMMPILLLFPFEVKMLQKEYFNTRYSLKAYVIALSLVSLIPAILPVIVHCIIIYVMTDQPMEIYRFFGFLLISSLTLLVCQEFGRNIGCLCSPKAGALIGSAIAISMLLLVVYNVGRSDTYPHMKFLVNLTFTRHSFAGFATIIMKDREPMNCPKLFCYMRDTQVGMRLFSLEDNVFYMEVIYLIIYLIIFKLCTYFLLRLKVTPGSKLNAYT